MNGRHAMYVIGHIWIVGSMVKGADWMSAVMLIFGGVIILIAHNHKRSDAAGERSPKEKK